MQRLIIYLMLFLFGTSAMMAEKKEKAKPPTPVRTLFKDARASIKNKRDQGRHEQTLEDAMKREDLKNEERAELRHIQALLNVSMNDAENLKAYLKQKYDTASYFNTMLKTSRYALLSDSLDALPNAKGKVKFSWRSKNRDMLLRYRANVYNGGRFYLRKNDFQKALPFFELFHQLRDAEIVKAEPSVANDTLYKRAAFYAMVSAYNVKQPRLALQYIDEAIEGIEAANRPVLQEYKVRCLNMVGDTAQWVAEMQRGCSQYPLHNYFFTSLMDYYESSRAFDLGISLADSLLQNVQDIGLYYYGKSLMYLHKEDWKRCIEMCDSTLVRQSDSANALYNKGISYVNLATEYADRACYDTSKAQSRKDQKIIQGYYKEALPLFELLRKMLPDDKSRWANPLYRIYLKLNMGKEFAEMEKLLGK